MAKLVEIFCSYQLTDITCAKSMLDAHEIYSIIQNEHHATMNSLHLFALGGYRLLVLDTDAEAAKELLLPSSQQAVQSQPEAMLHSGKGEMQNKATSALIAMTSLMVWIGFVVLMLLPWVFQNISGGSDSITAKFILTAIGLFTIGIGCWWFQKWILK